MQAALSSKDSAPGPDGIPYAAWRSCAIFGHRISSESHGKTPERMEAGYGIWDLQIKQMLAKHWKSAEGCVAESILANKLLFL